MVHSSDPGLAEILKEVRRIEIQTRRLVTGAMAGGYLSVFRGSGIEFEEVREYAEGDPQRAVDWNVTARMGKPYVKTYVDERELTVLFLVDLSASMDGGFGIWSARQTAARVCACLGLSAVRNGDKVGFVPFTDQVDTYVSPRKGNAHALRIVRDVLALPGKSAETSLRPALEFASSAVPRHAIVFVISDFFSRGWEQAMTLCARRHDVIAVRLLGPELDPAITGLVRLRDPESGATVVVDGSSPRGRAGYLRRVAAWRERTEQGLKRSRVDRMDVPIPREPGEDLVSRPILKFFRMREQRGLKR